MEVYNIPVTDDVSGETRYIIYHPLAGLAFIGNRAMADLVMSIDEDDPAKTLTADRSDIARFLYKIGFFDALPPSPCHTSDGFSPTAVVLMPTNDCQLRCVYCYAAAGELPPVLLPDDAARTAIDYVCEKSQEAGRNHFHLTFHGGGEPTYEWNTIKKWTEYARQKPLEVSISMTTNGIWSEQQCQWIIDNLDTLTLSIDGRPETQDRNRPFASGEGSSAIIRRTIDMLDHSGFSYGARMTAVAPWDNLVDEVRYLYEETNCQVIQVDPAFQIKRGGHARPTDEEARSFIDAFTAAMVEAEKAGKPLRYTGSRLGTVTHQFCSAPFNSLVVYGDGIVVTCYEITTPDHPLAPISTIGRIENGEVTIDETQRSHLHALMAERRENCRDCFCYWSCAGDCYVRTFHPGEDGHLKYGVRCEINREILKAKLLRGIEQGSGVWRNPKRKTGSRTVVRRQIAPL